MMDRNKGKTEARPGNSQEDGSKKEMEKTHDNRPIKKMRIAALLLAIVVLVCAASFALTLLNVSQPVSGQATAGNLTESSPLAAVTISGSSAGGNATLTATYFYGEGCIHCEKIKPFIADLETRYPELRIEKLESYRNTTNNQRFQKMNRQYGINKSNGFPTVFIGRNASSGETEVRDHFEEYILAEKQRIATGTPEEPVNLSPADPGSPQETPALNLFIVVFAALVDSINPCAFAVLIILIAYLTSLGERRRIAVVGCTYIVTVFIVYFIAGLGLLTIVQGIGLTGIVFTFAAVVAIIAGLINIAEVLLKREIFTLAIPGSQKDAIDRYIKRASVPSAVVLGALVAMVELPCTGGIYLAILGLLGDRMTLTEGIPYLLLYNLIFVLPLVLILIVMYWGGTPERLEAFRSGSKRWVRLVMGIVMVVLGVAMLLGVI